MYKGNKTFAKFTILAYSYSIYLVHKQTAFEFPTKTSR